MSKFEIHGIYQWGTHVFPYGINIIQKLWWRFMPGVIINVVWPVGEVFIVDESSSRWDWSMSAARQAVFSADPNDHYRPWLEEHVGRQGWDWNWGLLDNNAAENRLTIKFRRGKESWATMAALKWN